MSFNAEEKALLERMVAVSPLEVTEIDLYRFNYKGLTAGRDFFVNTNLRPNDHPLYDYMDGNAYLESIRDVGRATESVLTNADGSRVFVMTQNAINKYAKSDANPAFAMSYLGEFTLTTGMGLNARHTRDAKGVIVPAVYEVKSTAVGFRFSVAGEVIDLYTSYGIEAGFTAEGAGSQAWSKDVSWTQEPGWYGYADVLTNDLDVGEFNRVLQYIDLNNPLIVRDMGVKIGYGSRVTGQNVKPVLFDIDLPFVKGTRRWVAFVGGGDRMTYIGGYILGEGPDLVSYRVGVSWSKSAHTQYGCNAAFHGEIVPFKNRSAAQVYVNPKIDVREMFPISWNTLFVNTLYGQVEQLNGDPDLFEMFGNVKVNLYVRDFVIGRISGQFDKNDYRNYLETGFGIFPPCKPERVAEVMETWNRVADKIYWQWEPRKCDGYTFKNTKAFKEHKRMREKACKTNNYLELQYNDEYTNKQVENKLAALNTLDVWAIDATLVGSIDPSVPQGGVVSTVTRVTTITKLNEGQFSYAVNDAALAGTLALSEEAIETMIDRVMPSSFVGDVSALEAVLGESLADVNTFAEGTKYDGYALGMSSYIWPEGPRWDSVKLTKDYDGQMAFLCAQVTDFAQFNAYVPKMTRSLFGDKLYPKMVELYNWPEEEVQQ